MKLKNWVPSTIDIANTLGRTPFFNMNQIPNNYQYHLNKVFHDHFNVLFCFAFKQEVLISE
jgi:hypothetical protein